MTILLLDAAGLSLFCVTGATKSLDYGLGPAQAVILGAVTAVGGGTIRDIWRGRSLQSLPAACTPYLPW